MDHSYSFNRAGAPESPRTPVADLSSSEEEEEEFGALDASRLRPGTAVDSVDVFFRADPDQARAVKEEVRTFTASDKVADTIIQWNKHTHYAMVLEQSSATEAAADGDASPHRSQVQYLARSRRPKSAMGVLGPESNMGGRVERIRHRREAALKVEEERRKRREDAEAEAKAKGSSKKGDGKKGSDSAKAKKKQEAARARSPFPERKRPPGELGPLDWQAVEGTHPLGVPHPVSDHQVGSHLDPAPSFASLDGTEASRGQAGALEERMQERQLEMEERLLARRVEHDTLNLSSVGITLRQAALLRPFLLGHPEVQVLLASGGAVDDHVARLLTEAVVESGTVTALDIADNRVTEKGVQHLTSMINRRGAGASMRGVRELVLRGNQIGDKGAVQLGSALSFNKTLDWLDVSACGIESKGGAVLLSLLAENACIKELGVAWNRLAGDEVVRAIHHGLWHNKALTKLDLSHCGLHEAGGQAVGAMLAENDGLKVLDISSNDLGPAACAAIAEGLLGNETLLVLEMRDNPTTFGGGLELLRAFHRSSTLRDLDLGMCAFHHPAGVRLHPEHPSGRYRVDLKVPEDRALMLELLKLYHGVGAYTWAGVTRHLESGAVRPFEMTPERDWPAALPRRGVYEVEVRVPATPPEGVALPPEGRLELLLANLSREGVTDEWRCSFVRVLGCSAYLTSAQAAGVAARFEYDDDRAAACAAVFPRIVDVENIGALRGALMPLQWEALLGRLGALGWLVPAAPSGFYRLDLSDQVGRTTALLLQQALAEEVESGSCPGYPHEQCWRNVAVDGAMVVPSHPHLATPSCRPMEVTVAEMEAKDEQEARRAEAARAAAAGEAEAEGDKKKKAGGADRKPARINRQGTLDLGDRAGPNWGAPKSVDALRGGDFSMELRAMAYHEGQAGAVDFARMAVPRQGLLELDFSSFRVASELARMFHVPDRVLDTLASLVQDPARPFQLTRFRAQLAALQDQEAAVGPLSTLARMQASFWAADKATEACRQAMRRVPPVAFQAYVRERILACIDRQIGLEGELRGALQMAGLPGRHLPRVENETLLVTAAAGEVVAKANVLPDYVWVVMEGVAELVPGKEKKGRKGSGRPRPSSAPADAGAGGGAGTGKAKKGKKGKKGEPPPPVLAGPGEVIGGLDIAIEAALGHTAERGGTPASAPKLQTRKKRDYGIRAFSETLRVLRVSRADVFVILQANPMVYDNLRFKALEIHIARASEASLPGAPGWKRVQVQQYGPGAAGAMPWTAHDVAMEDHRLHVASSVFQSLAAHHHVVSWQVVRLLKGPLREAPIAVRAELAVAAFPRLVDGRQNFSNVLRELSPAEQLLVSRRLGYPRMVDRMRPGGIAYALDLGDPGEYRMARVLVNIAVRGGGFANLLDVHLDGRRVEVTESPRTWSLLSKGDPPPLLELLFDGPSEEQYHLYAIMTIQARWRGRVEQTRWNQGRALRTKRKAAASVIQSFWRQRIERRRVSKNLTVLLRIRRRWVGMLEENKRQNPYKWKIHDLQKQAGGGSYTR